MLPIETVTEEAPKHPCPDCGTPLRLLSATHREWACPVALRGLVEGKLSAATRHQCAVVYVERPQEKKDNR